ncbi:MULTISPECIES: MOSC domain-containing protein [Mumia]|uniref:MOSC domain-containing protein n=1 Tax=Mumia TaxID=1546255 RepID=UPI00141F2BFF|nr:MULTISPECIES: MOSC domain-containing protein [unclassified Mumia]QMW67586.1 MOSC domain-containing protein [Mumia sp. ZJ1417]
MGAYVESVCTGRIKPVPWGSLKRSAIDKRPVSGPVRVGPYGLDGDEIADLEHHGGVDQAVYAYAAEDLEDWSAQLGRPLPNGTTFGENLTTRGIDVNEAVVGERWGIGTTVLEVCGTRIPCAVFAGHVDQERWARRFVEARVPGAYLRVVEPGELASGNAIEVVDRPAHGVTVRVVFRALATERDLLPALLDAQALGTKARRKAEEYVATQA